MAFLLQPPSIAEGPLSDELRLHVGEAFVDKDVVPAVLIVLPEGLEILVDSDGYPERIAALKLFDCQHCELYRCEVTAVSRIVVA